MPVPFDSHAGLWGYIDHQGSVVIQPRFEEADLFSGGLAAVKQDGKWGRIDGTGQIVIEPVFDGIGWFQEGLAGVLVGEKWGYIDGTGRIVIEPVFDGVGYFYKGLAKARVGDKWGFIGTGGSFRVEPAFEDIDVFSEGLAAVKEDGKWGYVDVKGRQVIEPRFRTASEYKLAASPFHDGLAAVCISDMADTYGYIDRTGKVVLGTFDEVRVFNGRRAAVRTGRYWGVINPRGEYVLPPKYKYIALGDPEEPKEPIVFTVASAKGELWGIVDDHGQTRFLENCLAVLNFSEGLAAVAVGPWDHPKWGFIDFSGRFVIEPRFDHASFFSYGLARVGVRSPDCMRYGYIDRKGSMVIPARFVWLREAPLDDFFEGVAKVHVLLRNERKEEVHWWESEFDYVPAIINKSGLLIWYDGEPVAALPVPPEDRTDTQ